MARTSHMTVNKGFVAHGSARRCCGSQLLGKNRCECIIQILRNATFWMCLNMCFRSLYLSSGMEF